MTPDETVTPEWTEALERLAAEANRPAPTGDSLADMLSYHLSDIAKQSERIADAL